MDRFDVCPKCGSNMCYVQELPDGIETHLCLTCGYTTNSKMVEGSELEQTVTAKQAQLYKDLKFVDQSGLVWYPAVFSVPDKGMVYLDINKNDEGNPVLQWAATPLRKLTPKEQRSKKYRGMKYVADTKATKYFNHIGFMEAAVSLGMFDLEEE